MYWRALSWYFDPPILTIFSSFIVKSENTFLSAHFYIFVYGIIVFYWFKHIAELLLAVHLPIWNNNYELSKHNYFMLFLVRHKLHVCFVCSKKPTVSYMLAHWVVKFGNMPTYFISIESYYHGLEHGDKIVCVWFSRNV